ncbi:hypothetical protein HWV62_35764 [Athelia sp. TMB]|nr:hypothetical protein HWV62_35764 [Athelia sp. TMB]
MVRAVAEQIKENIVLDYYEEHMTVREIAAKQRVSIGLVSKVLQLYGMYGSVINPFASGRGWQAILDEGDILYIEAILEANPGLYLDEIQAKLQSVREIDVSVATISRTLTRLELTRKTTTRAAAQRDEELREVWEVNMAEYTDPELFVFLDESGVDQSTAKRTQGRSRLGTRCVRRATFVRGERVSVLPALSCDGIIAAEIFEGTVNRDKFLTFLREQLVSEM